MRSICPNDFALILFIHEGLHHFSIDVFIVVFFSLYSEEIYSSFLDAHPPHPTPAPSHPSFFKSKIVNPFQTCQRTDTFCQIQSSSSLLLKKRKTTQRGQHQYHIFGVPEQALPGGYWGPCLYVILHRLFSYTVLLPIKASGHWKKQP